MTLNEKIASIDVDKISENAKAYIEKVKKEAEKDPARAEVLIDGLIAKITIDKPDAIKSEQKISKAEAQEKLAKVKQMKKAKVPVLDKFKKDVKKQYPDWDDDRVETLAKIRLQAMEDRQTSIDAMIDNLEKTPMYQGKPTSRANIDYVAPKEPNRVMRQRMIGKDAKTSAITEADELRMTKTKYKRKSPTFGKAGGAKRPYYYEYRMNRRDVDSKVMLAHGGMLHGDEMNPKDYVLIKAKMRADSNEDVTFVVSKSELNKISRRVAGNVREKAKAFVEVYDDMNDLYQYEFVNVITTPKDVKNYIQGHNHTHYSIKKISGTPEYLGEMGDSIAHYGFTVHKTGHYADGGEISNSWTVTPPDSILQEDLVDMEYYLKDSGWDVEMTDESWVITPPDSILQVDLVDVEYYLKDRDWDVKYAKGGLMYAKGGSTSSRISVPVDTAVSKEEIDEFVDYVDKFYGKQGIYASDLRGGYTKKEIRSAVMRYLDALGKNRTWGHGDSFDRELVLEYLSAPDTDMDVNDISLFAKGGEVETAQGISKDTTYVPNANVKELFVVMKGKTKKLSGTDIVNGVYVKKASFKTKNTASTTNGKQLFDEIVKESKTYDWDVEIGFTEKDIASLLSAGLSDSEIKEAFYGSDFSSFIKADTSFGSKTNGILASYGDYQKRQIDRILDNAKNNMFEIGLKYPNFKWDAIIKKYNINPKPVIYKTADYEYEIFVGDGVTIGHTISRKDYQGKWESEGNEIVNPAVITDYQAERDYFAGFNGGYWGIVTRGKSIADYILITLLSQSKGFVKDLETYNNGLGGIGGVEVLASKIKFAKGGGLNRVQFTKLATLGYRREAPNQWRFVDLISTEDFGSPVAVGDIYKSEKELLADLDNFAKIRGYEYAKGGEVSIPNAEKMFHLPMEMAVYVPSTYDVDKKVSRSEMNARINEVEKYLAETFGGFTSGEKEGGYLSSKNRIVTEKVVPVTAFASKDDFNKKKGQLVNKMAVWAKKWGQEAIGFEFEGDLYYVPQKFKKGGRLTAHYIPQSNIAELKTVFGETFKGKDLLDGAYAKRKPKTPKMVRQYFEDEAFEYANGGSLDSVKKGDKVLLKDGTKTRMATVVSDGLDSQKRIRVRPDDFPMDISVSIVPNDRLYVIQRYASGGLTGMSGNAKLMIEFIIADVYEDDYEQGEGEYVNGWNHNEAKGTIVKASELVKWLHDNYYLPEDKNAYALSDGRIFTSMLVDANNDEASESEKEAWKKGKMKLYTANYSIGVKYVSTTDLDDETLSEMTGIGMYKEGGSVKTAPRTVSRETKAVIDLIKPAEIIHKTNNYIKYLDEDGNYHEMSRDSEGVWHKMMPESNAPRMSRTMFEEEVYEYRDGGGVNTDPMLKWRIVTEQVRFKVAGAIGLDKAIKLLEADMAISPYRLLEKAVYSNLLLVDEINADVVDAAIEEAEDVTERYRDSGEGIGSSDITHFIYSMLNSAGLKATFVNHRLERVDSNGNVLNLENKLPSKTFMAKGGKASGVKVGDSVIFHRDPSGRLSENIYRGTVVEINGDKAKIDHINSNMKNVIREVAVSELKVVKYAKGGKTGEKHFVAQEDGILGIYTGSDAYSIQVNKGDEFVTVGDQDNASWWYVKKVDKTSTSMSEENTWEATKKRVNVDWDKLILTFPKGDKMIYAEMKEKYAKGGKTSKKGDVGKSGTQYGYTLKEWEQMAEKNGLLVSPKEWWKSREGKKYTDSFGRTQTIGRYSQDEQQEMMSYGYRIAIGMDLGSNKIPASAKKYVEDNNLSKYAKGGNIGFEELSDKVAARYAGKSVKPEYQDEYGKRYDRSEAKEVGDKVAGMVYWKQQRNKKANGGYAGTGGTMDSSMGDDPMIGGTMASSMFAKGGSTDDIRTLWRIQGGDAELLKTGTPKSIKMFLNKEQKKHWRGEKSIYDGGAGLESWYEDTTKEEVLRHNRDYRSTDQTYAKGGVADDVKNFFGGIGRTVKSGYEKTRDFSKKQIHDQKKRIALEVIDDTKDKVRSNRDKMDLKGAEEIVENHYADGGMVKKATKAQYESYLFNVVYH